MKPFKSNWIDSEFSNQSFILLLFLFSARTSHLVRVFAVFFHIQVFVFITVLEWSSILQNLYVKPLIAFKAVAMAC